MIFRHNLVHISYSCTFFDLHLFFLLVFSFLDCKEKGPLYLARDRCSKICDLMYNFNRYFGIMHGNETSNNDRLWWKDAWTERTTMCISQAYPRGMITTLFCSLIAWIGIYLSNQFKFRYTIFLLFVYLRITVSCVLDIQESSIFENLRVMVIEDMIYLIHIKGLADLIKLTINKELELHFIDLEQDPPKVKT